MDQAVLAFLTKGTFVLAVLVVVINFFIRRTVQLIRPDFKPLGGAMDKKAMYADTAAMWWNEIGLYALPVVIGANLGLVKGLGFLFDPSIKTVSGHVFYAAVVGWFADFLYEVIQKILYKSTGVTLPSANDLGSASSEVVVVHEERKEHHEDAPTTTVATTTTTVTVKTPEPVPEAEPATIPVPAAVPAAPVEVVATVVPVAAPAEVPPGPAPTALGGGEEPPKSG